MNARSATDKRVFEAMLIVVSLGMTFLLYQLGGHKIVALNLFFLPVVLSGYFLGRTHAGVLALFCALAVTIAATLDSTGFAALTSPEMVALALIIWAAILGLTALLVGTLCDERAKTISELHDAYVGVVEVLAKYLQSADPKTRARTDHVVELAQTVAEEMRLPAREIDDLRVGTLLHDLGNVEITTQLISKAMDTLQADQGGLHKYTFHGKDLVQSLGLVLRGAVPLLVTQDDAVREYLAAEGGMATGDTPLGAKIIRTVRAYEAMTVDDWGTATTSPEVAFAVLRKDPAGEHDPEVLDALERAVRRLAPAPELERALP